MATKLRRSNFHTDADNHVNESINAKLATNLGNISTGNITTTGYIAGPATFTIDPAAVGDNTGTLIVAGNLQVDGTTTTINSTTLEVDDLNITLASGAANATAANGAGITVDGASATITYGSASDSWSFNKNVGIGTVSPATTLETRTTTSGLPATSGTTPANVALRLSSTATTGIIDMGLNSSNPWIQSTDRTNLGVPFNLLLNPNGGNVGIGTSSVTSGFKLEVAGGDVRFGDAYNDDAVEIGWSAGASQGFIQAYDRAASAFRNLNLNNAVTIDSNGNVGIGVTSMTNKLVLPNAAYFAMQDTGGAESLAIRANTSNAMEFLTGGGERMRIDSSGRVGIGTAPAGGVQLDVRGTGVLQLVNTDTVQLLASSGGSILKNVSNNPLLFGTNNTERMRINSGGDICFNNSVANTASGYNNQQGGGFVFSDKHFEFATTSNRSAVEIGKNNANDGDLVTFRKQGTTVGNVSVTSSGTTYNTTSDIRLKIDIEPIADATDKVMAMNAVTHKWKDNPESDAVHGFIAQEMRDIVPEAVSGDENSDEMMSMDYGRITPVIVAALQDALKEIDMLKNRITELEAK